MFEPKAIEFCAVKVASMAGDMRMALDICRRAVEVFEAEVRRQQHTSTKGQLLFVIMFHFFCRI